MEKQSLNKHIVTYKLLQNIPALNMPCPRCGQHRMEKDMAENALSRYADIYICPDCVERRQCLRLRSRCRWRNGMQSVF